VPLDAQEPGPILAAAERTSVVRDATVGFFFHLFCDLKVLAAITDGLLERGFFFPDVKTLPLTVTTPDFVISTTRAPFPPPTGDPRVFLFDAAGNEIWHGRAADYPHEKEPSLGVRVVLHRPLPADGETAKALRLEGQDGFMTRPLQVGVLASDREYKVLAETFRSVAAPVERLTPESALVALSGETTLVVVSNEAASKLDPALRSRLITYVERGGILLTWGPSELSREAGVVFKKETRPIDKIRDLNYPDVKIKLTPPAEVRLVEFKNDVDMLAEAPDGAFPLLAALSLNDGTFFYSALPPFGGEGRGPYPYLLNTLKGYGLLTPIARAKRLEVYFDPGLREKTAIEDLVKLWARNGVRVVHAGAWHEYPEWTYEYDRLCELAHQNGMLVYAWFVLPLVSPKFWEEHPEWREKNPFGKEVNVDWRKAVSLVDPACRKAVKEWVTAFLRRYDFDGANLAGLHFGGEGPEKPEFLSPFSDGARREFEKENGFDPREIWSEKSPRFWKNDPSALDLFFRWRIKWTTRLHEEFLETLSQARPSEQLALTVTTIDGLARPRQARDFGVDVLEILNLRNAVPFTVQLMDPGEKRPWGAQRVRSLLKDYGRHLEPGNYTFHLNLSQGAPSLPVGRPTGLSLYSVIAAASPDPVAIYSEDSIPDADWSFLANALAARAEIYAGTDRVTVNSAADVRIALALHAGVQTHLDEVPWYASGSWEILVPPGRHTLTFKPASGASENSPRLVDSSCVILDTALVTRGLRFSYKSPERACVVIDKEPLEVKIDGASRDGIRSEGIRGYPLVLPPGRHVVVVTTESWSTYALRIVSLLLSGGIVAVSALALLLVGGLFL